MYNPFDKKIEDLTFDDLRKLIDNEVAEGFYVEFKGEFQENRKIAKSIASFANTYGGWYFIGIKDEEKTNIAKEIVGFDINKHKQPKEDIRLIVGTYIHPIPFFEMNLLKNDDGKHVLVICVPESFETPHILNDGVVYLRNGEISNIVKITDKHNLDRLYQKNSYFEDKLNSFLKNPFGITDSEKNMKLPFLNICILPTNFNDLSIKNFYEESYLEKLTKMVNSTESVLEDVPETTVSYLFENVTRTPYSIIFRDVTNGINSSNYTLEFFVNGVIRIKIPIAFRNVVIPITEEGLKNLFIKSMYQYLGENLSQCRLLDIAHEFLIIRYATKKYSKFFSDNISSYASRLAMIVEMENIFQLVPFVESEVFLEYIKKYHVPICRYEYKKIPDELSPKKWIELENLKSVEFDILDIFLMGLGLSTYTEIFTESLVLFIKNFQNPVPNS